MADPRQTRHSEGFRRVLLAVYGKVENYAERVRRGPQVHLFGPMKANSKSYWLFLTT